MSDLKDRLRGIYRIPITDGLGPAGGDEPDNPNEFVRTFETPPIHKEAATEIERLEKLLVMASEFHITDRIKIVKRNGNENAWAVAKDGFVLNTDGEFEYEPLPSSREDDFIARTRFSLEEAFRRAELVREG